MKVVQVKCPKCSIPITMKQKDLLFYCDHCGVLHVRDGGVTILDYEIADFRRGVPTENLIYVPFLRMYSHFVIHQARSEGGGLFKLSEWIKGGTGNSGDIFIFVPAVDFDPPIFKQLSIMFTKNPAKYTNRMDFANVPRMPASITMKEAMELADFVVVTMEAEKPGVLQQLDYSLNVVDARVIYLPFISNSEGLTSAL